MDDVRIEPFDAKLHDRTTFDCGSPELNHFLRTLVSQYEKRRLGRTYVAIQTATPSVVLGYYTLAASAISFQNLPPEVARKLPRHPVPSVLLARLAVALSAQRKGLGSALIADAILKGQEASILMGTYAIELLATDANASAYYARFGFISLLDDFRHMYLPMNMVEQQIAAIRKNLVQ